MTFHFLLYQLPNRPVSADTHGMAMRQKYFCKIPGQGGCCPIGHAFPGGSVKVGP